MARGLIVLVACTLGLAVLEASDDRRMPEVIGPQLPDDASKLRLELNVTRAILDAEQQKSLSLQKLNEAHKILNLEMQKQLDDVRRSLEATRRDRDEGLKYAQLRAEDAKSIQLKELREREQLEAALKATQDKLEVTQRAFEKLKLELIQEQVKSKQVQERNDQLLQRLEEVSKQLASMKRETPPKVPEKSQTPNIRGKIKDLQTAAALVSIDVGAESGLDVGNTLEVYRLGDDPKDSLYLGQLKIVRVAAKESVGRFTAVSKEKLPKVGDEVATSLIKK